MSSRRKSRPVRRLDILPAAGPGDLPGGVDLPPTAFEDHQSDQSLSPPCESPQDNNVFINSEERDTHSEEERDNATGAKIEETKKRLEKPPEGVYIVQPQGVSDDEGGQEVMTMATKPQCFVTEGNSNVDSGNKKRQLDGDGTFQTDLHEERKRDGLDLSVKKMKYDNDSHENPEEVTSSMDREREANEKLPPLDLQEIVPRYEKLVRLLSQGHALVDSLQEVGLTQKDLATYQRFRMQMMGNPQVDQAEDDYQTKQDPTESSSYSVRPPQNDASDNWHEEQDYDDEDSGRNGQMTQYSSSSLPATSAVVAAMMASLVSNNAGRSDESPSKSEMFQNLLKKSQMFSQSMNMPPKSPTAVKYSTSADAMDTITAGTVSSGVGSIKKGTLDPTNFDEDVFDKYISKFSSKNSCMQPSCPHINRDHFHCTDSDCNFQRFTNKSDVIRHYNMHKKRDNSLAHGFMRFAPTDSCVNQFGACHLNGKSTHYHCLHPNCTKVYTSTSDVMTHENFHKKNQRFVTNGFQRYKATETCATDHCPFKDQRTTHFHCTRNDCNFTFKNKCDIEKHKSYHMRDDAYARQGFKKFYKNEPCQFHSCAWNRTANHFHCLRRNCDFSFTSTSQMVSHKRKHDRQDLIGAERTNLSPVTSSGSEPRSAGPGKYDSFVFNEAAKKVLAGIPATVAAAALPRSMSNYSPNFEHSSLQAAAFNPVSTSSLTTTGGADTSYRSRGENPADVSSEYERPPPPYMEVPENMSNRNSPRFENERYHGDGGASEPERWGVTSQQSRVSPDAKSMQVYNDRRDDSNAGESQALNLSGKNTKTELSALNRSTSAPESDANPSSSVRRFFRGFVPDECVVANCIFLSRHHFHCVVQNCCAVFDDKMLVLNHTAFHDKLEKMGFPQNNSKQFPLHMLPAPKSDSSRDPNSPPPGYIALPVSNRPKDGYLERTYELDRRNAFFSRPNIDGEPMSEGRDNFRQEARETSQAEPKNIFNPEKLKEKLAIDFQDARNTSIYDYISRKVAENRTATTYPSQHPTTPISNSAYVMLQNPSIIASIVGNHRENSPQPQSSITSEQNPSMKRYNSSGGTQAVDGYIHVRAGMACLRADCKYVLQNHWHCTLNRCRYVCKSLAKAQSHREAHDSLEAYARAAKECFRSYTVKKNCPNPNCEFRLRGHYHCLKPGCQFVTIGTSKLPWHMKKHEKIARREAKGFKYYTKKEQCGKPDCKYSDRFSHYHCIRAGCAFAFQYKHQMSTHVRKHLRRMLGRSYSGPDMAAEPGGGIDHSNVDSGDDSLPLIVDEADELEQRPGASMETMLPSRFQPQPGSNLTNGLSRQQLAVLEQISRGKLSTTPREQMTRAEDMNRSLSENELMQEDIVDDIGDDTSHDEILDLRAGNPQDSDSSASSSVMEPTTTQHLMTLDNGKMESDDVSQAIVPEEADMSGYNSSKSSERLPENGAMFSKFRLNNDVMAGFKRFEISENCGDMQCNFAFKVTHYHCLQDNCSYRFTGRTHMFKHQQHHERVAGLVRDDFKRFKPTQDCEQPACTYNGSATHFHCLRCDFKCTDSAKVGVHRRQHIKADTLEQSGFERFRGKEDCRRENCKYRDRNTSHFHCLQGGCSYAVVGLSSIEQHYKKHQNNTNGQQNAQVNFSIFAKKLISQADSSTTNFTDLSLNNSAHIGPYSVPFSALTSTPAASVRSSEGPSPVMDERPSVSIGPYSVPITAIASTAAGSIRCSEALSPVTDDRPNVSIGPYSVPFTALASTTAGSVRCSEALSPITDERPSVSIGPYHVPISALASTTAGSVRCSEALSPVAESSASPSFTTSIVNSQFVDSGLIQNKQQQTSMDLTSPRDLSVNHDLSVSGLTGLQAGVSS